MTLNRYLQDVYLCRRSAVVLITGRPGVGKSRFLESFSQDCFKAGTATSLVVDGASCANLRFAVYHALFAKLLLKTLTPQQVVMALCRFLHTESESDPRVVALNTIFRAEISQKTPPLNKMDNLLNTVFTLLTRVRPLVLSFDNICADQLPELCAIVRELSENVSLNRPILVCVVNTTTNEVPTDMELALGNENHIWLRRGIELEPLSKANMHTLITQSLGVSEALSGFIENMSQGMPQIAVDLARQWQLAGFLVPTSRGYTSKQPISELPIPQMVHESILRQIHMAFEEYPQRTYQPVATIAALFGEQFTPKQLAAALKHMPETPRLISHSTFISLGLSGGLLKTLDETTLAFSNPLIRDALLATMQPYELQDCHRVIVEARREAQPSFDNDMEIASHLLAAHMYYDAFEVFLHLARQSVLWGNFEQARTLIESAKNALKQHLGFVDSRTPEMADIWFIEAEICLGNGDYAQASQYINWLEFILVNFDAPEKNAAYDVLKSRFCTHEQKTDEARAYLDHALECLNTLEEPLTYEQLEVKFSVLVVRLEYDMSLSQVFIDTARRLNDILYVGKAFLAIARRSIANGETVRATKILNMAIDTAHKNGDFRTESAALHLLSKVQDNAPEVRLKTLCDASKGFEMLGDFRELGEIHTEIATILKDTSPAESQIHAHWSALLDGLV